MKSVIRFLKEEGIVLGALIVLLPIICITVLTISDSNAKRSHALANAVGNNVVGNNVIGNNVIGGNNNKIAISNKTDLKAFATKVNNGESGEGYEYILTADIDVSGEEWEPIAVDKEFQGIFNGNGFTISGVTITKDKYQYVGLFGKLGTNGIIRNLKTENFNINTPYSKVVAAGNIVAQCRGEIVNCYNLSSIQANERVGGIVGIILNGKITKCRNSGSVNGNKYVGGIAGWANASGTSEVAITTVYNTENVKGLVDVGGIVGHFIGDSDVEITKTSAVKANKGYIISAINTGKIQQRASGEEYGKIGGIVGYGEACMIKNVTSTGNVEGGKTVGGLAGTLYKNASLTNSLLKGVKIKIIYNMETGLEGSYLVDDVESFYDNDAKKNLNIILEDCAIVACEYDDQLELSEVKETKAWMGAHSAIEHYDRLACEISKLNANDDEAHNIKIIDTYDQSNLYSYEFNDLSYDESSARCKGCQQKIVEKTSGENEYNIAHTSGCQYASITYLNVNSTQERWDIIQYDKAATNKVIGVGTTASNFVDLANRPKITITPEDKTLTNKSTVTFKIDLGKEIYGFDKNDIQILNGTFEKLSTITANKEYQLTVKTPDVGKLIVKIPNFVLSSSNFYNLEATSEIEIDKKGPELTSLEITSPAEGEYGANKVVVIEGKFSEDIRVTNTSGMGIKLKVGDQPAKGTLKRTSVLTDTIKWEYKISCGDKGILKLDSVDISGITDKIGNKGTNEGTTRLMGNTITATGEGHTWGEWIIDKAATYTEEGQKHRVCSVCNLEEKETIAKLVNKNPQIIFSDYKTKEVGNNKYVIVEEGTTKAQLESKIDKNGILGQTVAIDNLTEDGKLKTGTEVKLNGETKYYVVIKGDVNGDGQILPLDVTTANNIRLGKAANATTLQNLAADYNMDGLVKPIDITSINNRRLGK